MLHRESRITYHASRITHQAAFTMIEIAISLAVIGFALVAIISVLPLGMNVQKENRQETIINHDATVVMNAIRNGAQGVDDLTNYVVAITNYMTPCASTGKPLRLTSINWYTPSNSVFGPGFALTNGFRIVGLLSTPKYVPTGNGTFVSNHVVAVISSMSGPVSEKYPQTNAALEELAFTYRVLPEVVAFGTSYLNPYFVNPAAPNLQSNLHDVRLTFRWPFVPGTDLSKAPGRQVFRTYVGGGLLETNEPAFPRPNPGVPSAYDLYFFEPRTYVKANLP